MDEGVGMVTQAVVSARREDGRNVALRFLSGLLTVTLSLVPGLFIPDGPYVGWPHGWFTIKLGLMVGYVLGGVIFVPLLPLVSYRRRDWLFISFVPFWGYVIAARVGWRLANLPTKDWPPRPEEIQAAASPSG